MLFPDPSCIANETILKLKERGIYRLIGADWVAIATISFRGAIYLDAWEDLNGVDGQIPQEFLENNKHRLSDGESMENVFYRGIYILVIRFRETDKYACYNIYCRKDGPFEEKDIIWLKSYSKVNLEITRLNNEVIQNQELIGAVFNSISSAVLALQTDGSLLLSNQYAIDMFDLPTEYVGRNFFSFFDDAASTQIAQTIIDLAEGKNCATGKNLTIYHETKQKIFHFVISPLKNSKEQISGAVMVVQDVTRQKMMELELEQLHQQLANERKVKAADLKVKQLEYEIFLKGLAETKRTLDEAQIRSPRKAILTYINNQIGAQVNEGSRIAVISDLSHFKVEGEIADTYGDRVAAGGKAVVKIGSEKLEGQVSSVTPLSKNGVISFTVQLEDDSNRRLRSGLKTDVYVMNAVKEDVLRIANSSYYVGRGDYQLFVLDGSDELVKRKVRLGDSNFEYVEVVSGLQPGDRVVISDMSQYKNKNKLKLRK